MPRAVFRRISPTKLELRQSPGLAAIAGVLFFFVGLVMLLPPLVLPEALAESGPLVVAGGALFLTAGAVVALGRRWVTVDAASGTVTQALGLLVPMTRKARSRAEFNAVLVAFVAGSNDAPDQYPVRLRAASGRNFDLVMPSDFALARAQAAEISAFLRLPLIDSTSDYETEVAFDHTADTLAQRLPKTFAAAERPPRPPSLQCEITASSGETTLVVPSPGLPTRKLGMVVSGAVLVIALPFILSTFFRSGDPKGALLTLAILLAATGLPFLIRPRRTTRVRASRSGIVIEDRTKVEIPAADILDIDLSTVEASLRGSPVPPDASSVLNSLKSWVPSNGIVIKSRTGWHSFGAGLSREELEYLRWVMREALAPRGSGFGVDH